MNAIADAIQKFFSGAAESLSPLLAALSVIGVATMAIIQTAKDVTPLRRRFQESALRRWLQEGADEANATLGDAFPALQIQRVDAEVAQVQLVRLSVDGDEQALFSLSIEQMCGQMNSAVQVALDYPGRFPHLLLVAASNADPSDVRQLAFAERPAFAEASSAENAGRVIIADARNRVVHQLQRAIDGFQIRTSYEWKWRLQMSSFGVSVVLAWIAMWSWDGASGLTKLLVIVCTALAAGFLAPVARDLTAALQKMRA
ncbi:MAG: hypothetical protein H3C62_06460 [Gemmatimonadaceae bacterium]|nr:hypothetical protein [Gemmatimonadaceae bacterium]